jgi:hypothetical protein
LTAVEASRYRRSRVGAPPEQIEQLLIRYRHAIDERDWDAYRSVYVVLPTPGGGKISKRAERNYFHNMPARFQW